MLHGTLRWVAYGALVIWSLAWIAVAIARRKTSDSRGQFSILMISVVPFLVGSVTNRWLGQGHEGQGFVDNSFESSYVILATATLVIIGVATKVAIRPTDTFAIVPACIALVALLNTRVGDTIILSSQARLVFFPALFALVYMTTKYLGEAHDGRSSKVRRVVLIPIAICAAVLALRLDGLKTEGAWFHVSYFVGVVQGIKSGGLLLWDTPSQYGFLNQLLPALIPGVDAETAFLLFQALLLFLISMTVVFSVNRLSPNGGGAFFSSVFLILFYFADPALVGPQPFPSSSVMRFGPSLVVLLMLSTKDLYMTTKRKHEVILAVVVAISILWSFESAYYSLGILGMWTLAQSVSWFRGEFRTLRQLRLQIMSSAFIASFILLYSVYVFLRVGEIPTWKWFYLPASRFAAGFGGLPTDLWGAVWLIILSILGCLVLAAGTQDAERATCFASFGALLGWMTYYIGRSHSSNIIAIFPLIFVAVLIPTLRVVRRKQSSFEHSSNGRSVSLAVPLSVIVVLGGVVGAGVIANPLLPSVVARARLLPMEPVYEPAVSFPDELERLLETAEPRNFPIAYQGYMGMLPRIPDSLRNQIDSEGTWLPLPLGLLEEPIPEDVRREMLERRFQRVRSSGYFVWHKSMSHPGRAELWLREIQVTHDCSVIGEDPDWQVNECIVKRQ